MAELNQEASPLIGQIGVDLLRWQFRNHKATKEEAIAFVKDWFQQNIVAKLQMR